jgi:hypothetical protein
VLSVPTDYFIAERAVCNGVCPGHLKNCSCGKNGLAKVLFSLSVWLVKEETTGAASATSHRVGKHPTKVTFWHS